MVLTMTSDAGRLERLKLQLAAVEHLRVLKRVYPYRELARRLGIPETVLCRYVKGNLLPGYEAAAKIVDYVSSHEELSLVILTKVKIDPDGFVDLTSILGDPELLKAAAEVARREYEGFGITKVLTAAVNGIPLATMVAYTLGAQLLIAKKYREVGVAEFIEEPFIIPGIEEKGAFYIPAGMLSSEDVVLIVDDLVRTGRTLAALHNLVKRAGARIAGTFIMLAVGDEWRKRLGKLDLGKLKVLAVLEGSDGQ